VWGLAIRLSPIAEGYNRNHDLLVLDLADQAPVTDTVFPEFAQFAALERITDTARVIQHRDLFSQIEVFVVFQMFQYGFASVKGLAAPVECNSMPARTGFNAANSMADPRFTSSLTLA